MRSQRANTLDEAALVTHEMFTSYLRAGFTDEQALRIVIAMMKAHLPGAQQKDDDDDAAA